MHGHLSVVLEASGAVTQLAVEGQHQRPPEPEQRHDRQGDARTDEEGETDAIVASAEDHAADDQTEEGVD